MKDLKRDHGRRLTDAELLQTDFRINAPEAVAGWTSTKPPLGEKPLGVVFDYDVPHSPGSRDRMVWCCFCQEQNHYTGGVIRYGDGSLRTIGWKCCKDKHEIDIKSLRHDFDANRRRKFLLVEHQAALKILDDVRHDIAHRLTSPELHLFAAKRAEFFEKLEFFGKAIREVVVSMGGQIVWDEQVTIYSGAATKIEVDGDVSDAVRGAKTETFVRTYTIRGSEFVDLRMDPLVKLRQVSAIVEWAASHRPDGQTDHLSDDGLKAFVRNLRQAIDGMAAVERAIAALPVFFESENLRELVAAYKKRSPRSRIIADGNAIKLIRSTGDVIVVRGPTRYEPWTFRTLGRLRRAINYVER